MSDHGFYKSTVGGAAIVAATTPCSFLGAVMIGSAGGTTLTIYDKSGGSIISTLIATTNNCTVLNLAAPIACRSGLYATCSGTGAYTLFYGK